MCSARGVVDALQPVQISIRHPATAMILIRVSDTGQHGLQRSRSYRVEKAIHTSEGAVDLLCVVNITVRNLNTESSHMFSLDAI